MTFNRTRLFKELRGEMRSDVKWQQGSSLTCTFRHSINFPSKWSERLFSSCVYKVQHIWHSWAKLQTITIRSSSSKCIQLINMWRNKENRVCMTFNLLQNKFKVTTFPFFYKVCFTFFIMPLIFVKLTKISYKIIKMWKAIRGFQIERQKYSKVWSVESIWVFK